MFRFIRDTAAEQNARLARASAFDDKIAAERGRLFAARAIIENPEQRIRVESHFGIDYCKERWPEAYYKGWWKSVLKWIPRLHPTDTA